MSNIEFNYFGRIIVACFRSFLAKAERLVAQLREGGCKMGGKGLSPYYAEKALSDILRREGERERGREGERERGREGERDLGSPPRGIGGHTTPT